MVKKNGFTHLTKKSDLHFNQNNCILKFMKIIDIVTGASSGMGICFAKELARECLCDEIWIIARRAERLEKLKEEIDAEGLEKLNSGKLKNAKTNQNKIWPKIKVIPLDISGAKGALELKKYFEQEKDFEISVLVNNAGFGTYGEFANTSTSREMEMIDLNCTALTGITGFALPYMKKGARIINTASLASFSPLGNFAVYGACKAYVLSFGIALAAELKPKGISVTSLCPGPVSTEFANVASNGARKEVRHGLSPEKTVRHAIKASRKGRLYSMYAFKWRFKAFMTRFLSRHIIAYFTFKYCKRPSN